MKKALLLLLAPLVLMGQITVPNSFTPGTTILSSQVNANFAKFSDALNRTGGTMTGTLTSLDIIPTANNASDLGSSGTKFRTGYFGTGVTIGSRSLTDSGSVLLVDASAVNVSGKQSLWIPASAMAPTITNGATGPTVAEMTSGNPNLQSISFVNGSQKNAQFTIAFPKSWNASTITYQVFWTGTAAGAGTTIWGMQCVASADNATLDAAFGTAVEITDTFLSTKASHVSSESSAVTISGAAADTHTTCQIYRKGGSDTRAAASLLLGIKLFFTTNAKNDA